MLRNAAKLSFSGMFSFSKIGQGSDFCMVIGETVKVAGFSFIYFFCQQG